MGGSAEVWRALDERNGHLVAVKRPHRHLLSDPGTRERLIAEARAVATVAHPGIVRVLDIEPAGDPAIIFELVDGEPLSARLQRAGPLRPRTAAGIARGLARALYHAHVRGVIHRDVKPGNVLLDAAGQPHLVDFGIARVLGEAAERRTETGLVMGTLRYMAPEQLTGEALTPRVDLYGLGVVLHEMLTGQPPYPARWPAALLAEQASGPPPLEGVDPALRCVVRACLRERPADRPLHAGVVAAALGDWLEGDASAARALEAVPSNLPDDDAVTSVAPIATPPPRMRRRRPSRASRIRQAALAAAGLALLLLGVAAAGLTGPPTSVDRAAAVAPSLSPSGSSLTGDATPGAQPNGGQGPVSAPGHGNGKGDAHGHGHGHGH